MLICGKVVTNGGDVEFPAHWVGLLIFALGLVFDVLLCPLLRISGNPRVSTGRIPHTVLRTLYSVPRQIYSILHVVYSVLHAFNNPSPRSCEHGTDRDDPNGLHDTRIAI